MTSLVSIGCLVSLGVLINLIGLINSVEKGKEVYEVSQFGRDFLQEALRLYKSGECGNAPAFDRKHVLAQSNSSSTLREGNNFVCNQSAGGGHSDGGGGSGKNGGKKDNDPGNNDDLDLESERMRDINFQCRQIIKNRQYQRVRALDAHFRRTNVVCSQGVLVDQNLSSIYGPNKQDTMRIHHGRDVTLGQFPSYVQLYTPAAGNFCGGVLVTQKHVLTARHCVDGKIKQQIEIIVGDGGRKLSSGEIVRRKEVARCMHPESSSTNNLNSYKFMTDDWAIILLDEQVPLNEFRQLACMPMQEYISSLNFENSGYFSGKQCYQVGNGRASIQGKQYKDVIQYTKSEYSVGCKMLLDKSRREGTEVINERPGHQYLSMLTAKDGSKVRKGDSGGPLLCKEKNFIYGDLWTVEGVLSQHSDNYSWCYLCADLKQELYNIERCKVFDWKSV